VGRAAAPITRDEPAAQHPHAAGELVRPGRGGVTSTTVRWCAGRKRRTPKSPNTTSSEHPDVSRRSNVIRTGRPAFTRTTAGE
jgi:hypothetical protein